MPWVRGAIVALGAAIAVILVVHLFERAGPRSAMADRWFHAAMQADRGWDHGGWDHGGWDHGGWDRRGWHRWHDRSGPGVGLVCRRAGDLPLDRLAERGERLIEPRAEQREAWTALLQTLETADRTLGETCAAFRETGAPRTAPEALARMDALMVVGLEALRDIRAAFERLYGVLDEEQRERLDGLVARRA